jgi:hypothetical protein
MSWANSVLPVFMARPPGKYPEDCPNWQSPFKSTPPFARSAAIDDGKHRTPEQ